jgi:hypothetical protein
MQKYLAWLGTIVICFGAISRQNAENRNKSEYSVPILSILKNIRQISKKKFVFTKKSFRHIWTLLFSLVAVSKLVFYFKKTVYNSDKV